MPSQPEVICIMDPSYIGQIKAQFAESELAQEYQNLTITNFPTFMEAIETLDKRQNRTNIVGIATNNQIPITDMSTLSKGLSQGMRSLFDKFNTESNIRNGAIAVRIIKSRYEDISKAQTFYCGIFPSSDQQPGFDKTFII